MIGTATSESGAAQISAYLAEAGAKGQGIVLNVTDAAQTDAVLADIAKTQGAITILVNNAGITRDNLTMRMGDDEWDAVIDTNLKGGFPAVAWRDARHDEGALRAHRQYFFGGGLFRQRRPGQYCAAKEWRRRSQPSAGPRTR